MGIRVRKVIGYGFDDLNIKEGEFDLCLDKRFNPEGYFCSDWEERNEKWTMEEFQVQLKIMASNSLKKDWDSMNYAMLDHAIAKGDFSDFDDLIAFDPEFGSSNVCVFVPPGSSQRWCQNDSQVDYYEETVRNRQTSHVLHVDRPLYPYESWVDLRNDPPTRLESIADALHRQAHFAHLNVDPHDQGMIADLRKAAMDELGFESWKELEKSIVPIIPPELLVTLKYLKVFNNPSDAYRLKPMIYTFWS